MSKFDQFETYANQSDFDSRDAIDAFSMDTNPERIGRKAFTQASEIELGRITTKEQVRREYDPDKHNELVASLRHHGQQQPIVVYWSDEDEQYVVFMGHRRLRAAPEAGLTSLVCVVLKEPPSEAERIEKQLVENIVRENLNPIDEARAYGEIKELRGCTAKDLAKSIGRDPSTVTRALSLLKLPEDIQQEVAAGTLPKSVVQEIGKLKTEELQRTLLADYKDGNTYSDISKTVKAKKTGRAGKAAPRTKKSHTADGISVQVTAKRKATQIEIADVLRTWADELESDGRGKRAA